MKKIRGYMLLEMLLALVFVTSVAAMTSLAYTTLFRNTQNMAKTKARVLGVAQFRHQLYSDMWSSDSVAVSGDHIVVYRDTTAVTYWFGEHTIREQLSRSDTAAIDVEVLDAEEDELLLEANLLGEAFEMHLKKHKDPVDLVNENMEQLGD